MQERVEWIDVSKGIAIILVVLAHNIPVHSLLWSIIFSFHMPFFFLICGFLYKEKGVLTQIKSNFHRLILPYFATAFILSSAKIISSFVKTHTNTTFIWFISIVYSTGIIPSQFPILKEFGPLWFLTSLFCAILIFNITFKLTKGKNKYLSHTIYMLLGLLGYLIGQDIYLPWSLDIALSAQPFIYCGYLLKSNDLLDKKLSIVPFIILTVLWFANINNNALGMNSREYNSIVIFYIGSISGSILLIYLSKLLVKTRILTVFFTYLGKETLVIMCFHLLESYLIPWQKILHFGFLYNNPFILVTFKMIFLIVATFFVKYIPILKEAYYFKQFSQPVIKNNSASIKS